MDSEDGSKTHSWNPEFRQFDFIFRTGCNSKLWQPSNVHPGVEGFRADAASLKLFKFSGEKNLLVNFREPYKIKHSVTPQLQ